MTRFNVGAKVMIVCHPRSKFRGQIGKIIDIKTDSFAPRTTGVTGFEGVSTTGTQIVYSVSLDGPSLGIDPLHDVREAWLELVE